MNKEVKEEGYRRLSIAALVTGIVTIILIIVPIISEIKSMLSPGLAMMDFYYGTILLKAFALPFSPTAIICGSIDLTRINQGLYSNKGKGLDIFGIVSGGIFILVVLVLLIRFIA